MLDLRICPRRRGYALLGALFLSWAAWAQPPRPSAREVDSLSRVVEQHPRDTLGANALLGLLKVFLRTDTARASGYGQRGLELATRLRDTRRLAALHYQLGTLRALQGRLPASIAEHQASARYYLALGNSLYAGHNYRNIGNRYTVLGNFEQAMRYHLRGLRLREAAHDTAAVADSYSNIGQIYVDQQNYPAAQAAYEKALAGWQRVGNKIFIVDALNHLGIIQRDQRRYARARAYLGQGAAVARTMADSANLGLVLISLGVLEQQQNNWPASLPLLLRAEKLYQTVPVMPPGIEADLLSIIGETLTHVGQLAQAEAYLRRALSLSRQGESPEEEIDALSGLATLAATRRDYAAAYRYQRRLAALNDSLRTEAGTRTVAELQTKYETEQKEARNRLQAAQLRIQQQIIRRRNTQLGAGLLVAALLAGVGYLLYTRRRLRREVEFAQERQLLERARAAAVLEAEEQERRRIGSDLHDGLGQLLTAAKLNLNSLNQQLGHRSEEQQLMLDNALAVVDESFAEVRSISHNLMPNALIRRGLAAAVREFLGKLSSAERLRIQVEVFGLDERLAPAVENVLFRVIQELVQNVVKHAQATELTIQLIRDGAELTVLVEDNGRGFDPAAAGGGIGLRNVQTRLAYLGGQAEVDSRPGRGTTVTLTVPLAEPTG